jgi:probable HAF family extracellular repeat protein
MINRPVAIFAGVVAAVFCSAIQAASNYQLIDLGSYNSNNFVATDINDSEQIVGSESRAASHRNLFHAESPFYWTEGGGLINLSLMEDERGDFPIQVRPKVVINANGQVSMISAHTDFYYTWSEQDGIAFNEEISELDYSVGSKENTNGYVAFSHESDFLYNQTDCLVWNETDGLVELLTAFHGIDDHNPCQVSDISENNQITGMAEDVNGAGKAFLWDVSTGMVDIGSLLAKGHDYADPDDIFEVASVSSRGMALNDNSQVVGYSFNRIGNVYYHMGFIWSQTDGMQALGTLGCNDADKSWGLDINNSAQVVGKSFTNASGEFHAFLYQDNSMVNLCSLVDCADAGFIRLTSANAINNTGSIVGSGLHTDGTNHAFYLKKLADNTASRPHDILSLEPVVPLEVEGTAWKQGVSRISGAGRLKFKNGDGHVEVATGMIECIVSATAGAEEDNEFEIDHDEDYVGYLEVNAESKHAVVELRGCTVDGAPVMRTYSSLGKATIDIGGFDPPTGGFSNYRLKAEGESKEKLRMKLRIGAITACVAVDDTPADAD